MHRQKFAAVCLAKAFSCFNATVVAFGHRGNDDFKNLPFGRRDGRQPSRLESMLL